MMRMLMLGAMLALASCGPQIRCDDQGMIVIPADASVDLKVELQARNVALAGKRWAKTTGDPKGQWLTEASLAKAEGCP